MTQQDIFRVLLLVLLNGNNQLQNGENINFSSINELIIFALLLNTACPIEEQTQQENTNTTF